MEWWGILIIEKAWWQKWNLKMKFQYDSPPSNSIFKRVGMVLTSPDWTQPKQWLKKSFAMANMGTIWYNHALCRSLDLRSMPCCFNEHLCACIFICVCVYVCVCARACMCLWVHHRASTRNNVRHGTSMYIICLCLALLSQITSWPTECNLHSSWHRAGVWSVSLRTSDSCDLLASPLSWHRENTCFPCVQVWGHIIYKWKTLARFEPMCGCEGLGSAVQYIYIYIFFFNTAWDIRRWHLQLFLQLRDRFLHIAQCIYVGVTS